MVRTNPRLFIFLPLAYVAIFFGLVVFQFSLSESFSHSLGDLTISGTSGTGQGEDSVVDLLVKGRGLVLNLTAGTPVLLETTDGTVHRARPRSYKLNPGRQSIVLDFQFGVRLEIQEAGRRLILQPTLLENPETIRSVSLPLTAQEVPGSSPAFLPAMEVRAGSQRGFLLLKGAGDLLDRGRGYVVLRAQKGWLNPVTLNSESTVAGSALEAWLYGNQPVPENLDARWKDFWTKAYLGWSGARYLPTGFWDREGTGTFSDGLAALYFQESLAQGTSVTASARIAAAAKIRGSAWESMPYSGNSIESLRQKRREMEILSQSVTSGTPVNWADNPWLIRDAYYHGPQGLYAALRRLLLEGTVEDSSSQTLGVLSNLLVLRSVDGADIKSRSLWALERLVNKVTFMGGKAYLVNTKGFLDVKDTAAAGLVLARLTAQADWGSWKPLAAAFQDAALSLAGPASSLPRILMVEKDGTSRREGLFYPEDLYPYRRLTDVPPGERSLAEKWGSGAFIRSSEALQSMDFAASAATFTFRQPLGATHSFVLQNVPPFNNIRMHNIRWRPDPQFQLYSDGYFYSEATRTLFVKITHRTENVTFQIRFTPDEPGTP